MKVLFIKGEEDYDALTFEQTYKGQPVATIIHNLTDNPHLVIKEPDDTEYEISFRIKEFDIDINANVEGIKEFCQFIRNDVMDYDIGKTRNFYLETEILPE